MISILIFPFSNCSYLAHAGSLGTTASIYRIGYSTIYVIIKETCTVLVDVLKPRHLAAPDEHKWLEIADEYYERYNFPNCLGAIDGKQIQIKKPDNSGSLFRNYNKYDSIVLLAACDAKCRFTWYNIGDFGKFSIYGRITINKSNGLNLYMHIFIYFLILLIYRIL